MILPGQLKEDEVESLLKEAAAHSTYHYACLSEIDAGLIRSPGPGLGNLLFPISRALVGQKKHGGKFVYPTLRQLKIGSFLRGERDKRTYGELFRGRRYGDWRHWVKARSWPSLHEDAYDGSQEGVTVRYDGLRHYFHDIRDHREVIVDWIMTNACFEGLLTDPYDIGIHVRLGDFALPTASETGSNLRLPMNWYRDALKEAKTRHRLKTPKIVLFTDGNIDEVRKQFDLSEVGVDPAKNAITAIFNLSRAKTIITSRSTFSMWAAYIGNTEAIWDKAFDLRRYFPDRGGMDEKL